jgi:hypothetical protein
LQGSEPPEEICWKPRNGCKFYGKIVLRIGNPTAGTVGSMVPDPNGASTPKWVNTGASEWTVNLGDSQNKTEVKCGGDLPISFKATPAGTTVALDVDLKLGCGNCSGERRRL